MKRRIFNLPVCSSTKWRAGNSMPRACLLVLALFALVLTHGNIGSARAQERVPGLVYWLGHSLNRPPLSPQDIPPYTVQWEGGDLGAPRGHGFIWLMFKDKPDSDPAVWKKLPPGIVLGLKHSTNQKRAEITVFGYDPVIGPNRLPGFKKMNGGDRGAPIGVGYYWYESIDTGDSDWRIIWDLPRGTVVGLRHSMNQKGLRGFWWSDDLSCEDRETGRPVPCNSLDPDVLPPPGFVRVHGGDLGAPRGQGFYWYEKRDDPWYKE